MTSRTGLAAFLSLAVLAACSSSSFDDVITSGDSDGDTVSDDADNCPTQPNPGQLDTDDDGFGEPCDCTTAAEACLFEGLQSGNCANGRDDDGDQLADALDPNCQPENAATGNCGDGIDNDGDRVTDCAEADCAGAPGCPGGP